MSDGQVVIDITGDASRYEAAVKSVAKTTESALSSLGGGLKAVGDAVTKAVTVPVAGIGTAVVGTAVSFLSLRESAQTAFETMLGSGEAASRMIGDLYRFAKTTPFKFDGMLESAQQLISMGMEADNVIPTLTAVGDAAAASGKGQEGFAAITTALGKMQAQGQVSLDDLWSLSDNGVQALQILANSSGQSIEDMKKAISDGTVDASWAIQALADGIENGTDGMAGSTAKMGGMMGALKNTFRGACDSMTSSIRNLGLAIVGEYGTADAESSKFLDTLTRGVQNVTSLIDNVAAKWTEAGLSIEPVAGKLADGIGSLSDKIADMDPAKFEAVAKTIGGLAAAGPILAILGKGLQVAAPMASGLVDAFSPIAGLAGKASGGLSDVAGKAAGFASTMTSAAIPAAGAFAKSMAHGLIPQSAFDAAKQLSTDLAYGFRDSKADIADAFSGAKDAIASKFSGVSEAVGSKLGPLKSKVSGLTSVFGESAKNAADTFAEKLGGGLGKVADVAKAGIGKAGDAAKAGLGKVASGVGAMAKGAAVATVAVGAVATGVMGLGIAAAAGGVDLQAMADGFVSNMQQITAALPAVANQASQLLPGLVDQVVSALPALIEAFVGAFGQIVSLLPTITPSLVDGISQLILALGTALIEFAPQLLEAGMQLFAQIVQALAEIAPQLAEQLPTLVASLAEALVANLPALLDAGVQLFCALIQALAEAAPLIAGQLPALVETITTTLIGNLPALLQAGLTLFLAIATALLEAAPQIISTLIGMLPQLADTLIGFLPTLGTAAGQLFGALVQAIPKIAGELLGALGDLLGQLPGKVADFAGRLVDAGYNMIMGLVDGIGKAAGAVVDAAVGAVSSGVDAVLSFLGIASPSKLFRRIGVFVDEGLAKGIGEAAGKAVGAMRSMASDVSGAAGIDVPAVSVPVEFEAPDFSGLESAAAGFALEAALSRAASSAEPTSARGRYGEDDGLGKVVDALERLTERVDRLDRGLGRKIADNSPDEVTIANARGARRALGVS